MNDHDLHCCEDLEEEENSTLLCFLCQKPFISNAMLVRETKIGTNLPRATRDRFFIYLFWEVFDYPYLSGDENVNPQKRVFVGEIRGNKVFVFKSKEIKGNLLQIFIEKLGNKLTEYKNLTGKTAELAIVAR